MAFDQNFQDILDAGFQEAKNRNHEFFTIEHILFAALLNPEGQEIIENNNGDVAEMLNDLERFLAQMEKLPDNEEEPFQTVAVERVLTNIDLHVISSSQKQASVGDFFAYIYNEEDSIARFILESQGISRLDIVNYLSHGISHRHIVENLQNDEAFANLFAEAENNTTKSMAQTEEGKDKNNENREKILSHFTVWMTQEAREGKYDVLINRENELQRTIEVLMRRTKNNPLHVGEAGVGKTALTQGLAQRIVDGKVPGRLAKMEIYSLDMGALIAGTRFRGDFEERLKVLLKHLLDMENVILFIDEIHTIINAGAVQGGTMDAANLLKPVLAGGKLRCIGSTTYDEYQKYFIKDRALARRFQKIDVTEPSIPDAIKILQGLQPKYEEFHNVSYSKQAIIKAVELSATYLNELHLPDKAIDVMDESGASVTIYRTNNQPDKPQTVTQTDVEKLIARMARIPLSQINEKEKANLTGLEEALKKSVFAQDIAIQKIARAVKRHRSGLGNIEKPIGSFLFIGPTGVGKTELARTLAKELAIPLIRFDMSEYMEKHTISRLLGSPPGYVGFDQGALLTDAIRKTPHCVLLLDEIEKAHTDIFNALLQIMDHATITDSTGRSADFRNVILLMTSNAGSKEMSTLKIGFDQKGKSFGDPMQAVRQFFSPEFRNRLDDIILFNHLEEKTIILIAEKFIGELNNQLKEKKISIHLTPEAVKYLAHKGYSPEFGARPMSRLIQEEIKDPLVDLLINGQLKKNQKVIVKISPDENLTTGEMNNATNLDEKPKSSLILELED